MSQLDYTLSKISGVAAKFSGATRRIWVQAVINPAFLDAGEFTQQLLNRLQNNEWGVEGNTIDITEVQNGNRWNVSFIANVESQYSTQDVQQAILDVLTTYFNITPSVVEATVKGGTADNPFHAGNVYGTGTTPKPVQTVTPVGVQTPNPNPQPKPKAWLDTFIDPTTQKITGVGIGLGLVFAMVLITQKR